MTNQFIERSATKRSISLRRKVLSIGINDADYITGIVVNGKAITCPYYLRWRNMIIRCYSKTFRSRNRTYNKCYVCDDWLIFSAFKSWMIKQKWSDKHLDKDCIIPGNKIYSPDFCSFIDSETNMLLTDSGRSRGKYKIGVSFHKRDKVFQSNVRVLNKLNYLGSYETEKQASDAYIKAKVEIILKAATEQKDPRVANGLRLHADILLSGLGYPPLYVKGVQAASHCNGISV